MARFIVIGAGVFGASTALHLKRYFPDASVTILERSNPSSLKCTTPAPSPDAASSDLNKIIRADYADADFRKLAIRAIEHWRTDEGLRPFYHEVGLLLHSLPSEDADELKSAWAVAQKGVDEAARVAEDDATRAIDGADPRRDALPPLARLCETQEDLLAALPSNARASIGSCLQSIGRSAIKSSSAAYCNPRAGWAEAKEATSAVLQHAVERGVRILYNAEAVEFLTTADSSTSTGSPALVRGVRTADGRSFELDDPQQGAVFLCGGSWTPHLLQTLLPATIPSPAPPVVFSAQTVLIVRIPEDVARRHASVPVVLNYDTGFYCFEPRQVDVEHSSGKVEKMFLVKCAIHDRGYQVPAPSASNGSYPSFSADDQHGSHSKLASASARSHIPADHQNRMLQALRGVWPEYVEHGSVHESRICWYAESTDENWLIDGHPSLSNLIVASADSGHGFKFLPIIGELITARLPAHIQERATTPIPALNEHWNRVFSWAHHERCFRAERETASSAGPTTHVWAEWKPDRDSASKVNLVPGGDEKLVGSGGHAVSRGL
ncbi:hypothetical protein V8E36_009561 [Tilletia maclaganii]